MSETGPEALRDRKILSSIERLLRRNEDIIRRLGASTLRIDRSWRIETWWYTGVHQMATIRENARFGAVISTLLATSCLSTDESFFESVPAPDEQTDQQIPRANDASAGETRSTSEQQGMDPVGLVQPSTMSMGMMGMAAYEGEPMASDDGEAGAENEPIEPAIPFEPCVSAGLLGCDDFEAQTSGIFPSQTPWRPELSGCGTHLVDESGVSHSGARALRADGGGYPECMLHLPLTGETDVFVRSFVRLGAEPALLDEYISLFEWGSRETQDEPEIRVGLRPSTGSLCAGQPGLDVSVSGLARGSVTDCTGQTFEPDRWYCVQAHLTREAERLSLRVVVDGSTLVEREYTGLNAPWQEPDLYFKLGRAAYGASTSGSLWHDDVAVGRESIPCGP